MFIKDGSFCIFQIYSVVLIHWLPWYWSVDIPTCRFHPPSHCWYASANCSVVWEIFISTSLYISSPCDWQASHYLVVVQMNSSSIFWFTHLTAGECPVACGRGTPSNTRTGQLWFWNSWKWVTAHWASRWNHTGSHTVSWWHALRLQRKVHAFQSEAT